SGTTRTSTGAEVGLWVLPDLRLGAGYNFAVSREPLGSNLIPQRRGFYFTITSKLSRLFDLFGTSRSGLEQETSPDKESQPEKCPRARPAADGILFGARRAISSSA